MSQHTLLRVLSRTGSEMSSASTSNSEMALRQRELEAQLAIIALEEKKPALVEKKLGLDGKSQNGPGAK